MSAAGEGEDMFHRAAGERSAREAPLAARMRPRSLDEFAGQEHIVGPGRLLRRAIEADRLSSLILHGPPGCGKTALARVIAETTRATFVQLNAVTGGVADVRREVGEARERRALHGRRTILFIDEIHRFNRAQQDALLPHVESGTLTLIGATTENPFFEVIAPLVSRARVFELHALRAEVVRSLILRALQDEERGLGTYDVDLEPAALDHLVDVAGGDCRSALNALELAVLTTEPGEDGRRRITRDVAAESIQRRIVLYDRLGDRHYDAASAFIKSMRGSDPDAALHWLARMIEAGEDPGFIARRVVIFAAEDVGLADPHALMVATSAAAATEYVGFPEARLPLAMAVLYCASAPKSNSVIEGIDAALKDVRRRDIGEVPIHLRNPVTRGAVEKGYGRDYRHPHDFPGHFVPQDYLPEALRGRRYFHAKDQGFEARVRERLRRLEEARRAAAGGTSGGDREGGAGDG